MLSEPLLVVARIVAAFDQLSVSYAVGGSLASSVYGIPRATQDVDLVADLRLEHVEPLVRALAGEFYVDGDMIVDAIQRRASFNVVHLSTMDIGGFNADMSRPPEPWFVDPAEPRAPPQELWDRMSEAERERVVESLPSEFPVNEAAPPEGDRHFNAKMNARRTLGRFFERMGRRIYSVCELPVYYPEESLFAPDVMAVVDVDCHERDRWVVAAERKGLDFALEVHVPGSRRKDHEHNVARFARLGITEYFLFDRGRLRLSGYRLASPESRRYEPIVPQHGHYASSVLGLELGLEGERLRFYVGDAPVPESDELIDREHGEPLTRTVREPDASRYAASQRQKLSSPPRREPQVIVPVARVSGDR
jgi:Uma2 family endonuclease